MMIFFLSVLLLSVMKRDGWDKWGEKKSSTIDEGIEYRLHGSSKKERMRMGMGMNEMMGIPFSFFFSFWKGIWFMGL